MKSEEILDHVYSTRFLCFEVCGKKWPQEKKDLEKRHKKKVAQEKTVTQFLGKG